MKKRVFSKSLTWLISAVIFLMCFFREPKHQWMYIAVFGIWTAFHIIRFLLKRIKNVSRGIGKIAKKISNNLKQANETAQLKEDDPPSASPAITQEPGKVSPEEKLLLGHINYRITDKLKAVFPDAEWQWQSENPEQIARGGTGRIRIIGVDNYTHADVTVDDFLRISFVMLKMVNFQDISGEVSATKSATEATFPTEPVKVDVTAWYEWVGKEVLYETITELNTRGYSRVFIKETGDIYVVEDGNEAIKARLNEMPSAEHWMELVKVLTEGDLRAEIDNGRLSVAWA